MTQQTIYLDSAATTPLDPEVLEAMMPFLKEQYANPSSVHPPGQEARKAVEGARESVAALLGAEPRGVVFTSGGSEANNLAVRGLPGGLRGDRIIVTRLEHASVLRPAEILGRTGFDVVRVSNDSRGRVDLNHLEELLREKPTALLCVIHGSNEVGTLQDVEAIGAVIRSTSPRTWFHLDAVQSVGYVPVEARRWGVDSLSVSGHKVYGPKGSGLLALFRDAAVEPLIAGGGQEGNRRSGTENVAAVVGLAAALERAVKDRDARAAHAAALGNALRDFIAANIADARVNGDAEQGLPHILNVSFAGLLGEVLLHHLETDGIMVSTGSACQSAKTVLAESLKAMGIPSRLIRGTIRFSFSRHNTAEEIDFTGKTLARQVAYLREVGLP
jgi:cysteine desulfurase